MLARPVATDANPQRASRLSASQVHSVASPEGLGLCCGTLRAASLLRPSRASQAKSRHTNTLFASESFHWQAGICRDQATARKAAEGLRTDLSPLRRPPTRFLRLAHLESEFPQELRGRRLSRLVRSQQRKVVFVFVLDRASRTRKLMLRAPRSMRMRHLAFLDCSCFSPNVVGWSVLL